MGGLSLVAASGGHSSSRCAGLSLSRPRLLRSTGSRRAGSVVVAHGPSCSSACGIFPDQGSNPCSLHWQADSQPLRHQGSPCINILMVVISGYWDSVGDFDFFSSVLSTFCTVCKVHLCKMGKYLPFVFGLETPGFVTLEPGSMGHRLSILFWVSVTIRIIKNFVVVVGNMGTHKLPHWNF